MTPEHAKALLANLPFIEAFASRKTVQGRTEVDGNDWIDLQVPNFLDDPRCYRIKPTLHPDISFSPDGTLLPPRVGQWAAEQPLTEADIPEGHRPYVKGEKLRRGDPFRHPRGMEDTVAGLTDMLSDSVSILAFTLAPLPEPKLIPLTSEDLPPVFWIRPKDMKRQAMLVLSIREHDGAFCGHKDGITTTYTPDWAAEQGFQYSTDRKTWHPLVKEALA